MTREVGSDMFKIKAYGPSGKDVVDSICLIFVTNGVAYIKEEGPQCY